jgi:CRP-like cAMP-binding protein
MATFPLWHGLDPARRDRLLEQSTWRWCEPGTLVLSEEDPATTVFALPTGAVRVFYRSDEGEETLAKLLVGPALFGEIECFVGIPHLENVEPLSPLYVLAMPFTAFDAYLNDEPFATRRLLLDLAERFCIAAANERTTAFGTVEQRLAALLLSYLDAFGRPGVGGVLLARPISQDELARGLGVSRKSVQRTIDGWRRAGVIRKEGDFYRICQRDVLEKAQASVAVNLAYRFGAAGAKAWGGGSVSS